VDEPKPSTRWCGPGTGEELVEPPVCVEVDVDLGGVFTDRELSTIGEMEDGVRHMTTMIIGVYVILTNIVKQNRLDLHDVVDVHTSREERDVFLRVVQDGDRDVEHLELHLEAHSGGDLMTLSHEPAIQDSARPVGLKLKEGVVTVPVAAKLREG
jgi:hypothetical protein